ncbi:MAG: Trm112 family protein [Proteobacteria bacterium]|nr:Trm112 family protein [Pseudomonadota bacterium]
MIDTKLLQMLVCPLTKTKLTYDKESQELISEVSGLAYPIQNGVPIMLIDEARIINPDQVRLIAPHLLKEES